MKAKNMKRITTLALVALGLMATSCSDDDDAVATTTENLVLNISGLENLGTDYVYEGWIIVDGAAQTTGTFTVDDNGALSQTSFTLDKTALDAATTFVLTIEPAVGDDPAPSDTHILAGDFSGNSGDLTISHSAALGNDFSSAMGNYILATPSTNIDTDENKGLWFLDNSSGSPAVGLTLPTLPAGWVYEGWAIIDGQPVSSGRFTAVDMADMDGNPYAGTDNGLPPFPGEDFIMGTVDGLDLATATHISKAVISIEPEADNSPAPFTLKPLIGADLAADAAVHTVMALSQNLTFPTGTVSR
ncbi:hypothetical protein UJ101_02104 [Flavobacteriaceae bacterium UJ101]|nr:hypothetical protein UJ101_02104 [Flavobacteriaceae bacterium UJ101]